MSWYNINTNIDQNLYQLWNHIPQWIDQEDIQIALDGIDMDDKKQIALDIGITLDELKIRENKFEKIWNNKTRWDISTLDDETWRYAARIDIPWDLWL